MKIYTRLGDKGETSLIGGKRVPKYHERIEACGMVDELISYIAVIRDCDISANDCEFLLNIQHILMDITTILAAEPDRDDFKLPEIKDEDLKKLENKIDLIENTLPELKSFVIPGGHIAASYCHVARNICRRAERNITKLAEKHSLDEIILKYINRLSDYLFVLSRKILISKRIEEILWKK